MGNILNGNDVANQVLGSSAGAYVKHVFKLDTLKFSWLDDFMRDKALRKKMSVAREEITKARGSLIDKNELRMMFKSAISAINDSHIKWFVEKIKAVQQRTQTTINSHMVQANNYIPHIALSEKDIEVILSQLPEGVTQETIQAKVSKLQDEILKIEEIIKSELSPPGRWIYRDDGQPIPYPQGCRWTHYVTAWTKIAPRYNAPVTIEGLHIKTEEELIGYRALGLHDLMKRTPLRSPGA